MKEAKMWGENVVIRLYFVWQAWTCDYVIRNLGAAKT